MSHHCCVYDSEYPSQAARSRSLIRVFAFHYFNAVFMRKQKAVSDQTALTYSPFAHGRNIHFLE